MNAINQSTESQRASMVEEWRPVAGFEGVYEISNIGNCRSLDRVVFIARKNSPYLRNQKGTRMKPSLCTAGYLFIAASIGDKQKCLTIARMVAIAFIPAIQGKPTVNHINGIKTDNRVENLEWASVSDQTNHAIAHGLTHPSGRKLNIQSASMIRKLAQSGEKNANIARIYGISLSTITEIKSGRRWPYDVLAALSPTAPKEDGNV